MFPDGMPGLGLLLLRATAGIALVACGVIHFIAWQEASVLILFVAAQSLICGLLLLLGLFNWFACSLGALTSLGAALALISVPVFNVLSARVSAVFTAAIAIALLCLGPGAYSLDARRHGHREIHIPARPRSSDEDPS
jgi:putative oxidoreductase